MNLPKKVNITGMKYTVHKTKKTAGNGSGHNILQGIWVGSDGSGDKQRETFIHEVAEMVLVERGMRYDRNQYGDSGDIMFVMDHEQFHIFITDLAFALKPLFKKGK